MGKKSDSQPPKLPTDSERLEREAKIAQDKFQYGNCTTYKVRSEERLALDDDSINKAIDERLRKATEEKQGRDYILDSERVDTRYLKRDPEFLQSQHYRGSPIEERSTSAEELVDARWEKIKEFEFKQLKEPLESKANFWKAAYVTLTKK